MYIFSNIENVLFFIVLIFNDFNFVFGFFVRRCSYILKIACLLFSWQSLSFANDLDISICERDAK